MTIESIRARVEAATPERWHAEEIVGEYHVMVGYPFGDTIGVFNEEGDAELAAYARTAIPLLLKVAEAVLMAQKSNPWGLRNADFTELLAALAELEAGE